MRLFDNAFGGGQRVFGAGGQMQVGTFGGEALGAGEPDALRTAGDQYGLAFKIEFRGRASLAFCDLAPVQ
jgi:hypothetical protein